MDKLKFFEIIAEFTTYEPEEIRLNMNFVDDLGIDSLDLAQIILSVESEFDIDLEDDFDTSLETVGDALAMLKARLNDED